MGFARRIIRSAFRNNTNSIVKAALVSGVATATSIAVSKAINNHFDSKNSTSYQKPNSNPSPSPRSTPSLNDFEKTMIAKLALGYYIARVDGAISSEEQLELDAISSELLASESLSTLVKSEITKIVSLEKMTFVQLMPFLERVNSNSLISLYRDLTSIANASGGISPSESKAIEVFKNYVSGKTGCTFEDEKKEVNTVSLSCDNCSGTMQLDSTYLKAVCPFCGFAKIIDANQISSVMERQSNLNNGNMPL